MPAKKGYPHHAATLTGPICFFPSPPSPRKRSPTDTSSQTYNPELIRIDSLETMDQANLILCFTDLLAGHYELGEEAKLAVAWLMTRANYFSIVQTALQDTYSSSVDSFPKTLVAPINCILSNLMPNDSSTSVLERTILNTQIDALLTNGNEFAISELQLFLLDLKYQQHPYNEINFSTLCPYCETIATVMNHLDPETGLKFLADHLDSDGNWQDTIQVLTKYSSEHGFDKLLNILNQYAEQRQLAEAATSSSRCSPAA